MHASLAVDFPEVESNLELRALLRELPRKYVGGGRPYYSRVGPQNACVRHLPLVVKRYLHHLRHHSRPGRAVLPVDTFHKSGHVVLSLEERRLSSVKSFRVHTEFSKVAVGDPIRMPNNFVPAYNPESRKFHGEEVRETVETRALIFLNCIINIQK